MRPLNLTIALGIGLLFALASGCTDNVPPGPSPGLGPIAVTKYVAVGNSISAGFQSNALFESAQRYSYPNLIAQQLRAAGANLATFEQPWYSDPGSPDPATGKAARYEIISLSGPVIGPKGLAPGSATNIALARPYDNLSVPGAVVLDFLDTTSFALKAVPPRSNPFFQLVLRQGALGKNMLEQARSLNPSIVTFWLGNNDVLGYATSGGVSPKAPTPKAAFESLYSQALDALKAALPNAKIAVGNLFDVTAVAFFTTVGPKMAAGLPSGVYLRYQRAGNTSASRDSTRLTEADAPLICLTGNTYATLLGQPTGKWYKDNKYPAIPAGIDTTKPFGLDPRNPWPDALALDNSEQSIARIATRDFNEAIARLAAAKGIQVVDFNAIYTNIKANGYYTSGQKYTPDYVSGGLVSLDGVHPSSRGQAVIANEFIKVMNKAWGMSIPYVDVSSIPGIPAPIAKGPHDMPIIPYEAFRDLAMLWGSGN